MRCSSHEQPSETPIRSDDSVVVANQTAISLEDNHPIAHTFTTTPKKEDKK